MSDLQKTLRETKFIMVTGTSQRIAGEEQKIPFSEQKLVWGYNNGMYAVADEHGGIWCCPYRVLKEILIDHEVIEIWLTSIVKEGDVHVPHSNDSGEAASQIWPIRS